jgi:hypothetical protein
MHVLYACICRQLSSHSGQQLQLQSTGHAHEHPAPAAYMVDDARLQVSSMAVQVCAPECVCCWCFVMIAVCLVCGQGPSKCTTGLHRCTIVATRSHLCVPVLHVLAFLHIVVSFDRVIFCLRFGPVLVAWVMASGMGAPLMPLMHRMMVCSAKGPKLRAVFLPPCGAHGRGPGAESSGRAAQGQAGLRSYTRVPPVCSCAGLTVLPRTDTVVAGGRAC